MLNLGIKPYAKPCNVRFSLLLFTYDEKTASDDHLLIGGGVSSHSSLRMFEDEVPSMSTLDSDSSSRETRPLCQPCYAALNFSSQKTLRVLLVGILLSAIHVIGILISGTEMLI